MVDGPVIKRLQRQTGTTESPTVQILNGRDGVRSTFTPNDRAARGLQPPATVPNLSDCCRFSFCAYLLKIMEAFDCHGHPHCHNENARQGHSYPAFLGLPGKDLMHSHGPWPFAHLAEAFGGFRPDVLLGNLDVSNRRGDGEQDTLRRLDLKGRKPHVVISMSRSSEVRESSEQNPDSLFETRHYANLANSSGSLEKEDFIRLAIHDESTERGFDRAAAREMVKGMHGFVDVYAAQETEQTGSMAQWFGVMAGAEKNMHVNIGNSVLPHALNRASSTSTEQRKTQASSSKGLPADNTWQYDISSQPLSNMVSISPSNEHKMIKPSLELCFTAASQPSASCKLTFKKLPLRDRQMQVRLTLKDLENGKVVIQQKQKGTQVVKKGHLQIIQILKQLLCGGIAGVISRSAVAPLDLIKTYLITSHGLGGSHKSALTVCKEIVDSSGWQGLFRGNLVNCIRIAPNKAIELCIFEMVRREFSKEGHPMKNVAATIAGGAAGMAGTVATYPLELIRTRLSVQPELYSGLLQAVNKISQEEGLMAFYSGLCPSLVGVFPYAATNYFVYDGLRTTYRRSTGQKIVPTIPTLFFGAVAAAASSTVTYPLEVARRQMQLSLSDALKKSSISVILDIYKHEGFFALYRGLGTTWLKLIPAAGISFVCYEATRLALHIDDASIMVKAEESSTVVEAEPNA